MLNIQSLIKFPIPNCNRKDSLIKNVNAMIRHANDETQRIIDDEIFRLYGFNELEVNEILNV